MKTRKRNLKAAFTLTELIVVIAIIGLLAGAVAVGVFGILGRGKETRIKSDFKAISTAIKAYYGTTGFYPTKIKDLIQKPANVPNWSGPYLEEGKIPLDPWGFPYKLLPGKGGRKYDIVTYGQDGKPGGEGEAKDYYYSQMK